MIKWPDILVNSVVHGDCVIFLGSGISCNSKNAIGRSPKSWKGLLEFAVSKVMDRNKQKIIESKIKKEEYLMACDLIRMALGTNDFNDLLTSEFLTPAYNPAEIHNDIFRMDAPVVITPNFDKIYDSHVYSEGKGTISILNQYSSGIIDKIRKREPVVLKIHGTIDEPGKMIFTKKDYAKARSECAGFYRLLESLIMTKTFLFLGAGLNDPDIQLLLENNNFQYGETLKHYFVIPSNTYSVDELSVYKSTLNLEFLEYSWSKKTKSHSDLLDSVKTLRETVESMRK